LFLIPYFVKRVRIGLQTTTPSRIYKTVFCIPVNIKDPSIFGGPYKFASRELKVKIKITLFKR